MVNRLIGILTLKAPVYKEVAEDPSALNQALIVLVATAVINGIATSIGTGVGIVGAVFGAVIVSLVSWAIGSWLLAFLSKRLFNGDTNTGEMLRVYGFLQVFGVVGILNLIPGLSSVVAVLTSILTFIGGVIAIREAAGFSTKNAVIVSLIASVIAALPAICALTIGGAAALLAVGATGMPQ